MQHRLGGDLHHPTHPPSVLHPELREKEVRTAKAGNLEDVAEDEARRRTRTRERVEEGASLRDANAVSTLPFCSLQR